jgi:hypothetical protein
MDSFLKKALNDISKQDNKICALMGDFNIDLIKYGSERNTGDFYDLLCSHSFRPLILQPTRVTSKTATLIDNIFINDISCHSLGGNVTSSISDHFFQFCQIDIFPTSSYKKTVKYTRDFRNCNKREFGEELLNIDWSNTVATSLGTEVSYQNFYKKLDELLDHMAPLRKKTQNEIRLEQRPWITRGLLTSMKIRDELYKRRIREKDVRIKDDLSNRYKKYRNMIVSLLKKSKRNYFASFFTQHHSNVRKTWDGIRSLINVSKQKHSAPSKLIYKNEVKNSNIDMAESLNDFFVNIGTNIENKIPQAKNSFSSFLGNPNNKSIFLRPCTNTEVLLIISTMQSTKASGPNSFSTNLLIEFSQILIRPLVAIINMSLQEGIFPSYNKEASICPIFKKGDKCKCENYRPISLLSNLSKIFERVMYGRLENFLKSSNTLYQFQFGFRKHYSTNHALLSIS